MSDIAILIIVLAVFLVLVLSEAPIALSLAFAATTGVVLTAGWSVATSVLGNVFFASSAKYSLFVIPMYILLGVLLSNAGIGEQIYRSVHRLVHRLPGGLAVTAVGATAMFSGISGSSAADVATFGRISVNEMTRHGYSRPYAAAVVAAAGTFASLIPPSIGIVIYGIVAEQSIGRMILAGVVPGIISALALVVFIVIRAIISKPGAGKGGTRKANVPPAAPAPAEFGPDARIPGETRPRGDWLGIVFAAIIFGIVIGGLYGGIFTATEAGAIGAAAAAVIALARPTGGLNRRGILKRSLRETADVTSMIFLLVAAGSLVSYFVARAGYARELTTAVTSLDVPPQLIIAIMLVALLVLGSFLDGLSLILLTAPILAPVVTALGFDGVWFGILMLKAVEIGMIHPPVGINVFIISGISNVKSELVFWAVAPFVVLDIGITALFFGFPEIVLWLPQQFGL